MPNVLTLSFSQVGRRSGVIQRVLTAEVAIPDEHLSLIIVIKSQQPSSFQLSLFSGIVGILETMAYSSSSWSESNNQATLLYRHAESWRGMTLIQTSFWLFLYSVLKYKLSEKLCGIYYTSHWPNTLGYLIFNYLPWRDCSARWTERRPVGSRWRLSPGWEWWYALPNSGWRCTGYHPRRRHILPDNVGIRICLLDRRHRPIPENFNFKKMKMMRSV